MGVFKCCVGGCSSTNETHRLFSFPKNDNLRNLWMSFLVPTNSILIGLSKEQILRKRVCEKHFDKHQFDEEGKRLRHSYPCLFTDLEIEHGVPLTSSESDRNALSDHKYCKRNSNEDMNVNDELMVLGRAGDDIHGHPLCTHEVNMAVKSQGDVTDQPSCSFSKDIEFSTLSEHAENKIVQTTERKLLVNTVMKEEEDLSFRLPNDMANYSEYHLMGKVSQIRLRPGCLPRKFGCQPDRKKRTESKATRPLVAKRKRLETIAECVREIEQTYSINPSVSLSQSTAGHRPPQVSTEHSDPLQTPSRPHQESCVDNRSSMLEFVTHFCKRLSTPDLADEQTHSSQDISMVEVKSELSSDMLEPVLSSPITMDKSIQVLICHKFRSKSTQTSTSFIKCCEHTCHRKPVNSWEI